MSLFNDPCFLDLSQTTAAQIASLQAKLNQQLGPEYISTRPGPGGGPKLVYAEGWKIINLANEVFGFNGWSSNLVNLATDFCDFNEESRRYNVGVTAIVRVTLRDGVFHEDVGYGLLENAKSKAQALDKCKKEAVTDGLKRTLRNFGNLLGNCLYDKAYTNEIVKVKVQPVRSVAIAPHFTILTIIFSQNSTSPSYIDVQNLLSLNRSLGCQSLHQPIHLHPLPLLQPHPARNNLSQALLITILLSSQNLIPNEVHLFLLTPASKSETSSKVARLESRVQPHQLLSLNQSQQDPNLL
ncbi:hypothetical protein K435DRAFT_656676 [Dendrothele bispora CBS 962.96]|uniref:Recombination protein Rad52 n=1 Tax=Dendrothele bispora (strain CBS 962.96) TaxID=1314807 RepID=A0A4S8MDT0_DENBC|nr:hypothetical protein K435DRAFT_656676 [Dendrothele bispora CBS 962.96]